MVGLKVVQIAESVCETGWPRSAYWSFQVESSSALYWYMVVDRWHWHRARSSSNHLSGALWIRPEHVIVPKHSFGSERLSTESRINQRRWINILKGDFGRCRG